MLSSAHTFLTFTDVSEGLCVFLTLYPSTSGSLYPATFSSEIVYVISWPLLNLGKFGQLHDQLSAAVTVLVSASLTVSVTLFPFSSSYSVVPVNVILIDVGLIPSLSPSSSHSLEPFTSTTAGVCSFVYAIVNVFALVSAFTSSVTTGSLSEAGVYPSGLEISITL